jgi:hypothetical protein
MQIYNYILDRIFGRALFYQSWLNNVYFRTTVIKRSIQHFSFLLHSATVFHYNILSLNYLPRKYSRVHTTLKNILRVEQTKSRSKLKLNRRFLSSGIQRRVVRCKSTDISEEHVASTFRVEETRMKQVAVSACTLSCWWNFGSLLGACLIIQIATGLC